MIRISSPRLLAGLQVAPNRRMLGWLLLLLGLAGAIAVRAGEVPAHVVLQLPYTHQFQFAGIYAAQAKGYFREAGLEVEVRQNTFGRQPLQELQSGNAQYGLTQGVIVLRHRLAGEPLVVLAAIMQHSPYALMSLRSSGIRNVQDLAGRRVAIETGSRVFEIRRMLQSEGIDPAKVNFITKKWEINELTEGTADAMGVYSIDAPYDMKQQGLDTVMLRPMDYGVDFYGDVLFTTEAEYRQHGLRAQAVRRAIVRGWAYALQHPDEIIDWILANLPERPARSTRERMQAEAQEMSRLVNPDLVELGAMNPGRWKMEADLLAKNGPELQVGRLDNFIPSATPELPRWVSWLGWATAAIGLLALLAIVESYRLKRQVDRRTRELRNSETEYRELFEQMPVPILVEDDEALAATLQRLRAGGVSDLRRHLQDHPQLVSELFSLKRIVGANRAALVKAGIPTLEELNHRARSLMTPQAMEMFVEEMMTIWEGRDTMMVEKQYRFEDGRTVSTLLNWQVGWKDSRPDYRNVRLVYTDLTKQKQAEQQLRASERRYRGLFEVAPVPLLELDLSPLVRRLEELRGQGVTDFSGHLAAHPELHEEIADLAPVCEANLAALALAGVTDMDEWNRHTLKIRTPETVQIKLGIALSLWHGRQALSGESTLRTIGGELRQLRYAWRLIGPVDRQEIHCLLSLVDITEQKQAEKNLRSSETRYRELFESAAGGVYRATFTGSFISLNPAFARMLGYADPAELIRLSGAGFNASLYVRPGRREEFMAKLGQADSLTDFESEVKTRDGSTVWISESVHVIRDESGRPLFFDGFVTDITARRRLESEILRASKLEAVGILAGGIAHDFNNILTVVLGNVTLAEMDSENSNSVQRMLRDAKQATLRARDLTHQLLTFAKGGDPVRVVVALPELLRESAGFAMHGSQVRAVYELAEDLWPVNVDKGQIGQVVQNLVINAVQAMPQGGTVALLATNVTLAAHQVGALAAGDYVRLTVADTGVGIASEHLAKIFDPYFTTKKSGTGLGLATVYSIIRKHQGSIEVESTLGEGTRFILWLPAAPNAVAAVTEKPPAATPFQGRILFMDDEEPIREMAGMFLKRLGLGYALAPDGTEAVRLYREALEGGRPFDLVIMDLTVPGGMGGREAMQQLLALHPAVKAIVSSGYSRDPVLANFRAHGFWGILPKPYGLDQLQLVLRNALVGSRPPF